MAVGRSANCKPFSVDNDSMKSVGWLPVLRLRGEWAVIAGTKKGLNRARIQTDVGHIKQCNVKNGLNIGALLFAQHDSCSFCLTAWGLCME